MAAGGAVPALQGLYPFFRGHTNIGLLFTRQRALTFDASAMRSWVLYQRVADHHTAAHLPPDMISLTEGRGRYCKVLTESGTKFWVDKSWYPAIRNLLDGN